MRRRWLLLLTALLAGALQAQPLESERMAPKALACLDKGGPAIHYPPADWQMRREGFLRLSLKFSAPDRAPETEVLFRAASDAMLDEVRWHVRGYRVPCLPAGEIVTAVQEFRFTPRATDPIAWSPARPVRQDEEDRSAKAAACMRTPPSPPDLWGSTFQRDVVNIITQLTFTAPDAAPDVKVVYSSAATSQVKSVQAYVSQYRAPCVTAGDPPYVVQQQFTYRPYGAPAKVFKDAVKLTSFLSHIKGIHAEQVSFDFGTMDCPFQVAWTLGRPAIDNRVGQVGTPNLNRAEFLAWLAGLEMNVNERDFELMLGQTLLLNVPCGRLTLAGEQPQATR